MSSNWKRLTLDKALVINPKVSMTKGEEYPFVEMSSIEANNKNVSTRNKRIFQNSGSRFSDGDTLMARITPCLQNGKISRYKACQEQKHAHGSTEFIVLRHRENISHKDFVYYLTISDQVKPYAIAQMNGSSGRQRVPVDSFKHLEINLPSLPEQKAIAEILCALDDKIELNRQMCKSLEDIASALFKSWFIDFDPVKAKAAGRNPEGLSPKIADLFPDSFIDSPLGKIPKGWEVSSIYELIDICYGAPYKSELFNQEKRGLPVIRIRDLKTGEPGNFTEEKHPREIRVHPGDVLAGMDAEFIPFIWKGAIAVLNQRVLLARPKFAVISNSFVIEMLRPLMAKEQNAQVGTTVAHIGKKDIDKFKICNPGFNILKSHQAICEPFLQKLINNNKQIYSLTKIRDTLLPKLISGEIKIQEAEMLISATI